ncbi:endophilin-A3b isoform X2 [Xyrichtys novacula]|uniref:Endophilin-A3b isoform X2 n=1 Tax=Xyrichtys novacula TaxID=13765 RepID=A0AAV1F4M5_XYRNO|nr:endophilin-A3b isoform X2 [Xyrichtys novacula]
MSVSGMKKQLHKASQLLNERLMGAEGTKMEEDFLKMEKSVMVINSMLIELLSKITEFLQPNPGTEETRINLQTLLDQSRLRTRVFVSAAYRAKLSMLNTMSRIRGQARSVGYPQTEGMLGECMCQYGHELGTTSDFGGALSSVGDALQEVAQARDTLDVNVKGTFIDPLQELHNTELKEIRYQLKKLNGRRLDFDYKKRRRGKVPTEELRQAWDKFSSSKEQAERSMFVLLQSDVDQLNPLSALISELLDFHRNAHRTLLSLHGNLQARLTAASNRPQRRFRPKKIRIRSEHNGSIGFYHQPSQASTVSSDEFTVFSSRPGSPISCYGERIQTSKIKNQVLTEELLRKVSSFEGLRETSQLFAEDVVLLAPSGWDLQQLLWSFAEERWIAPPSGE